MRAAARLRRLRLACWLSAGALGALQAFAYRDDMNPDGVSYLDLADAWRRGDWAQAVSLYWSPLYSWLLGGALALLRPPARAEFPVVHLVNLLLYVAALGSLEFFVRSSAPRPAGGAEAAPPEAVRVAWGYALFAVAALELVTLRLATPDLIVLAVLLMTAGLLCRLADARGGGGAAVALGALLGLGYLAKAVLLPVALLALALVAVAAGRARPVWPRVALALTAFALVAVPWIAAMSSMAGRPTLGENARLNYLWLVTREYQAPLLAYPGARPAAWRLEHPPRPLLGAPATFELAGASGGTLPIWYDPAAWHRGAPVRFDPMAQIRAVARNVRAGGRLGLRLLPLLVGAAVLLALLGVRRERAWLRREGVLLTLGVAPLAGYALIHVEGRYVAGPIVVLGVALLGLLRPAGAEGRRLIGAVCACVIPLQLVPLAVDTAYHAAWVARRPAGERAAAAEPWRAAEGLAALGVRPGDPVAAAGDYFQAGWARLARVRIVAVVDRHEPLDCLLTEACRARVVEALQPTGARALVVAGLPHAVAAAQGWVRLGDSEHWAWRLQEERGRGRPSR